MDVNGLGGCGPSDFCYLNIDPNKSVVAMPMCQSKLGGQNCNIVHVVDVVKVNIIN